jgi:hypothetical protein
MHNHSCSHHSLPDASTVVTAKLSISNLCEREKNVRYEDIPHNEPHMIDPNNVILERRPIVAR